LKESTFLINASRGALIDEAALAKALQDKALAGYAADVLSQEPPPADNPLLCAPNCVLTPHLSWASAECRRRIIETSAENLHAFLGGAPQNVVS
jgi:glycerate dehydrogenase